MHPAATVAQFALVEARRSGLPWLALGCLLAALALAVFVSHVALTESAQLRTAIVAALLRAGAAVLVALHVVTSIAREANEKGLELALALPISRSTFYLGKLAGFSVCGALLASLFALPLLAWSAPGDLLAWWLSLCAEAALVAAAALFFALTLAQASAIAATAALYLLARSIAAIQAIAAGPLSEDTPAAALARWVVDGVALLLPRLDSATRTDWLLYGAPPAGEWGAAVLGLVLYFALLAAAGLFDFHRRNL
jgi:ABC-type transport system involved in multi-copper enzyme maturation permease subunit